MTTLHEQQSQQHHRFPVTLLPIVVTIRDTPRIESFATIVTHPVE